MAPAAVAAGSACVAVSDGSPSSSAFASPKSRTLTVPSLANLDVPWFQIAMDDALLVSGLSAEAICRASASASSTESRRAASVSASVGPSIELQHEPVRLAVLTVHPFEAVDRSNVRVVQRREDLRFAPEACDPLGIRGESRRQNLDRHLSPERCVRGTVHLAHPSGAEERFDPIRPELRSRHNAVMATEQVDDDRPDRAIDREGFGMVDLGEQRVDLIAQLPIARTRLLDERRSFARILLEGRLEDLGHAVPVFVHRRVTVLPHLSLRNSGKERCKLQSEV